MVLGIQLLRWGPAACTPPLRASFVMCQGEACVYVRSVSVRRLLVCSALSLLRGCLYWAVLGRCCGHLLCVCGVFEGEALCLLLASVKCVKWRELPEECTRSGCRMILAGPLTVSAYF